jgi:hypothetical protein
MPHQLQTVRLSSVTDVAKLPRCVPSVVPAWPVLQVTVLLPINEMRELPYVHDCHGCCRG